MGTLVSESQREVDLPLPSSTPHMHGIYVALPHTCMISGTSIPLQQLSYSCALACGRAACLIYAALCLPSAFALSCANQARESSSYASLDIDISYSVPVVHTCTE